MTLLKCLCLGPHPNATKFNPAESTSHPPLRMQSKSDAMVAPFGLHFSFCQKEGLMSLCKILLVDPSLSLPSSIRGEDLSKTFSPRNALLFVSMVGDGCTFFL